MWAVLIAASLGLGSHVRSTDPTIGGAFADGLRESAVIRRLVEAIDASDVLVYLTRGDCPSGAVACLMMGGTGSGVRYIRIHFPLPSGLGRAGVWSRRDLSAMIAHELQHAAEIAGWPEVTDGPSLRAAYLSRGLDRGGRHLDTNAAIDAEGARRVELGQLAKR